MVGKFKSIWKLLNIFLMLTLLSCTKEVKVPITSPEGEWEWVAKNTINIEAYVVFQAGGKAYLGLGKTGDAENNAFYEFDEEGGWQPTQDIAPFPGTGKRSALALATGDKVYIGMEKNDTRLQDKDWWVYDLQTKAWSQLPYEFPGEARFDGNYSVVAKGNIYVTGSAQDFYELIPGEGWRRLADLPARMDEGGFWAIEDNIYAGGYSIDQETGNPTNHCFFRYLPEADRWETIALKDAGAEKALQLHSPASFTLRQGNKVYLYLVGNDSETLSPVHSCWRYDIQLNKWAQMEDFPEQCLEASGFSIGNRGFVVTSPGDAQSLITWEYVAK